MQTIMRTRSIKNTEIEKDWLIADANGQTLGRFASKLPKFYVVSIKLIIPRTWIWEIS